MVPAHLRTINSSALEYASEQYSSPKETIAVTINAAQVGPAERLINATKTERADFALQIENLLSKSPQFAISGGADRVFEDFLKLVQVESVDKTAVVPLLLPRSERASLVGSLKQSSNANVAALLGIRNQLGLLRLHPADHAAGAPYDSGVLTLSLLIEGGHFQPELAQQIGALATQAALGTPSAVRACEDLVIATLSLGRQLDFRSLANLALITKTPSDWAQMATLFRARPDRVDQLYAALTFTKSSELVFDFLAAHPESGKQDLDHALQLGTGAVNYLLEANQPIYRPWYLAAKTLPLTSAVRPAFLVSIAHDNPTFGMTIRFILFVLSGLAFVFGIGTARRVSLGKGQATVSKTNPMVWARDALLSIVFAITIWTFFEPEILKSKDISVDARPRIEFAVTDTLQYLESPVKAMQEINQVSLLVLMLFFVIQLVIYSFCLIKLREIAKQQLSAVMKIKLLENEENLFDFGLYVGLGGTVLSLILVAVGVVEASLMAAYASTLFGIIFTALLKVLHLRPYRRTLIIEADSSSSPETLIKDIKL
ncbi:MAG: hypothetical protein ACON4O_01810 [Lentimonas sp.]